MILKHRFEFLAPRLEGEGDPIAAGYGTQHRDELGIGGEAVRGAIRGHHDVDAANGAIVVGARILHVNHGLVEHVEAQQTAVDGETLQRTCEAYASSAKGRLFFGL